MSFLYPVFLWALTAVSIPVIIHLFSFRRHKTVYFSQTRFLESVQKESRSRTTLKQLLILLSRILAIAMLVFAFAQPVVFQNENALDSSQSQYVVVCVDNSYSMQNEGENGNVLNIAKQKATEIAEAFGQDVQYFLMTNDMPPRFYRPMPADDFMNEISKIEVTPVSSTLTNTMERLRRTTSSYLTDDAAMPVYIISDFQKSTTDFKSFDGIDRYDLQAVLVAGVREQNLSIDSVWFAAPFRQAGKPEQLTVLVKNHGNQAYNDIPVNLKLNDSLRGVSSMDIESNAKSEILLNYTNPLNGVQRATVEMDDYPVSFDNRFYFTYNLEMQKSILLIKGRDAAPFPVCVYEDDTHFDLTEIEEDQLDMSVLNKYDVLIFNGLNYISEGLAAQLTDLTENEISMAFIPGTDMHTESWNNFMKTLKGPQFAAWDSTKRNVSGIAWEHPFFKGAFSERQENVDLPFVHGNFPMQNSQMSQGENLLVFENDAPFMEMLPVKNALMYVFSSPLNTDYGNFIKHALFIPVAYNMAMNTPTSRNMYHFNGEETGMGIPSIKVANETGVEIRRHSGDDAVIPKWLSTPNGVKVFIPPSLIFPGHYNVFVNDEFADAFALNIHPAESAMEFYDKESLKAAAETNNFELSHLYEAETLDMSQQIKEKGQGIALWPWFLLGVLLFVTVEILLIKLM
ncbi:MAG: BatA domain-containing protein [Bacteroidota bacterium]|nr:BatA domain-containing protein [Bacteroidota bacterium]